MSDQTKRQRLYPELKRLHDGGLTYAEIGARVGLSASTVGDYIRDPTGEYAREKQRRFIRTEKGRAGRLRRARTEAHRLRCVDCGGLMGIGSHKDGAAPQDRCWECHKQLLAWRHGVLLDLIEGMWHDGWPLKEMAAAIGRRADQAAAIGPELLELRRAGRIGYRYAAYAKT